MKTTIIAPGPLYTFLSYCNESPMEKEILDCGAGGSKPPLALFFEYGYRTHGIDISQKELEKARQFCRDHSMELDISLADMRQIPFADESMSFVYSYSSICHMTKNDVAVAMKEITRVLKRGGLCYVSLCSAEGEPDGPGEYPYEHEGETGVHSLYGDTEADRYFREFTLLRKVRRRVECFGERHEHGWAEIEYIAKKL